MYLCHVEMQQVWVKRPIDCCTFAYHIHIQGFLIENAIRFAFTSALPTWSLSASKNLLLMWFYDVDRIAKDQVAPGPKYHMMKLKHSAFWTSAWSEVVFSTLCLRHFTHAICWMRSEGPHLCRDPDGKAFFRYELHSVMFTIFNLFWRRFDFSRCRLNMQRITNFLGQFTLPENVLIFTVFSY
jgi:hypothetical protein